MSDNPIDIPALIARLRSLLAQEIDPREADVRISEILAALEQAQEEIGRLTQDRDEWYEVASILTTQKADDAAEYAKAIRAEKARADAAESSEIRMSTLVGKLSDALDHAVAVHIRAQEDGTRLRDALLAGLEKADGLVATAAARGHDGWDNAGRTIVKVIREALAVTKETT